MIRRPPRSTPDYSSAASDVYKRQKESLISQLESPVLWFETINNIVSKGNLEFLEVGPGKVLSGLNKKINRDITTTNIGTLIELNSYEI